jgi:hypothetical protein
MTASKPKIGWMAAGRQHRSKRSGRAAQGALVNGAVGIVLAPRGRLSFVLGFTVTGGKIVEIDVITDAGRLRQLDLAILDD